MKPRKLLILSGLLTGMVTYFMLISSSSGVAGASSSGCGGGSCHGSGPTNISLTGIPAAGYVAGTTYTLTLSVNNASKVAAGFDLSASDGMFSANPANTTITSGNKEIHHTAPQNLFSGSATWTFNWTAPSSSSVSFNVAANAVDLSTTSIGDAWAITNYNYNLVSTVPALPTIISSNVTFITTTGATVNGTVNANNASTSVSVDYGTTVSYGGNVPTSPPTITGNAPSAVSAALSGLMPGTLYHFRIKATNSEGTTNGTDGVFTTQPTSVDDISKIGFQLYPNPVSDFLYIKAAEPQQSFELSLIGLDGRISNIVPEKITNGEYKADFRVLPKGMYFLSLMVEGKKYQYPFLLR